MDCLICKLGERNHAFCPGCGKEIIKTNDEEKNLIKQIIYYDNESGFDDYYDREMMEKLYFIRNQTYVLVYFLQENNGHRYNNKLMTIDEYLDEYHPKIKEILKFFHNWIEQSYFMIDKYSNKVFLKDLTDSFDNPFLRKKIYFVIPNETGFEFTNLGNINETNLTEFYESAMKYFGVSVNKQYTLELSSEYLNIYYEDECLIGIKSYEFETIDELKEYYEHVHEIVIEDYDDIEKNDLLFLFDQCKNFRSLRIKNCENFPEEVFEVLDKTLAIHFC